MKIIRVVAAVIRSEDKIFATARGYGEFKGQWEFPGGKIEPGETPEETTPGETEMPGAVTTAAERMTEQTTKQEKTLETTQKRRETAKQEKSENTGDNAHTGIWLMILGFGTAGILAGRQRKKNVE